MRRAALLSCLVWAACSDDAVGNAADADATAGGLDEDGGTTGGDDDDGTSPTDPSGSGGDEGVDDTSGPVDLPPPPATGIQIVEVTMDQGIRVPIARLGELVGPGKRNQPVLSGRPGVLRAFYETDPGFANRTLYGQLHVTQADGTTETFESFVAASEEACDQTWIYDCRYGSPTGAFVWRIPGEQVQPGMTYSIELFETSPGHEDDVSDKLPYFPATGGTIEVGVESSYMKMRVVVVPFDHDLGPECADPPDLLEPFGEDYDGQERTVAEYFGERLLAHNPADEVEIVVHDTIPYYGSLQGSQLLFELAQLRASEGAPPEYYYYGVARPCDGGPDFSGVAQLGGPFKSEASSRVGWGVYHGSISTTANTFVHEIGHEQGRQHIACNGEEGGPDPSYPDHPEGDTESWGIDVMAQPVAIQPPSSHDYMTYCGNTWVSEWGYTKVLPWIAEISSWERSAAPGSEPTQLTLHGRVAADGTSKWFVADDVVDGAFATEGDHVLRMWDGAAFRGERPARVRTYEHSEDLEVVVPLGDAQWADLDALELVGPLSRVEVDRADVAIVGPASERLAP